MRDVEGNHDLSPEVDDALHSIREHWEQFSQHQDEVTTLQLLDSLEILKVLSSAVGMIGIQELVTAQTEIVAVPISEEADHLPAFLELNRQLIEGIHFAETTFVIWKLNSGK